MRQRKYCDKLAEIFKSVFVLELQQGWLVLIQLLQNCVVRIFFSNMLVGPIDYVLVSALEHILAVQFLYLTFLCFSVVFSSLCL